jgi:hypothetical protein
MADSPVNPSQSDAASNQLMSNSTIAGVASNFYNNISNVGSGISNGINDYVNQGRNAIGALGEAKDKVVGFFSLTKKPLAVPLGAQPIPPKAGQVRINGEAGNNDMRVKIRVPSQYFVADVGPDGYAGSGSVTNQITASANGTLQRLGGIIFPYTPSITMDFKAEYGSVNPQHSNFALYFYKNSSVTPISISGKFTVQNEEDASVYLATVHLLRALTKMSTISSITGYSDLSAGSPPPVCRLDAYGDFMLANVPVVISSFRMELPDSVDYFTIGKDSRSIYALPYGQASVPTVSTISVTCIPMYSRAEMQKFSVSGWTKGTTLRKSGLL